MAESIDEQLELADVYAEALFELAAKADQVDAVRNELEELVKLAALEPGLMEFLRSGAIDDDERAEGLERMFRGKLSDVLLNTLGVMNQHGRAHLLQPLRRCFELRCQSAHNQVEVRATSAVALDETQQAEIHRLAAALSGKEPLIEYAVDASLVGGLVLQVGDRRFDGSIRSRLRRAREHLLERGERGLPASAVQ